MQVYRSKVPLVTTCIVGPCRLRTSPELLRTWYGIPEPGRAAHAARVAVLVAHEARSHLVGENMARPAARHLAVEPLDVRHAAAKHDDIGIEDVDHAGERACEALDVALEGRSIARGDIARAELLAGEPLVVRLESRPREIGLHAARAPAVAHRQRQIVLR